jgi:hypothetical protein
VNFVALGHEIRALPHWKMKGEMVPSAMVVVRDWLQQPLRHPGGE